MSDIAVKPQQEHRSVTMAKLIHTFKKDDRKKSTIQTATRGVENHRSAAQ